MNIIERINNLKVSQKAMIMGSIFAVIEFFYIIQFESKSGYYIFYVGLASTVWFFSFLSSMIYAEYVERPLEIHQTS